MTDVTRTGEDKAFSLSVFTSTLRGMGLMMLNLELHIPCKVLCTGFLSELISEAKDRLLGCKKEAHIFC